MYSVRVLAMQFLLALSAACTSIALHVQTGHGQTERCPTEATIEGASLPAMEAAADCMYTERLTVKLKSRRKDDAGSWRKELEETGHAIDTFLAPRFDWQVDSEPYPWQDFDPSATIVLRRNFDPAVQNISRIFASRQFPFTCQQQRMLAISDYGRFAGSFAASLVQDLTLFEWLLGHKGSPILGIYMNEEWLLEPRDSTFCDAPGPSGTGPRNRWLCFFLPLTNCSVEGDVLPKYTEERKVGLLVNAADGLESTAAEPDRKTTKTWRDMMEHFPHKTQESKPEIVARDLNDLPGFMESTGFEKYDQGTSAVEAFDGGATRAGFLIRNVLYRRNYRLRSLVAQEMVKHRELEEVAQGETDCIAMHLRRGDKADDKYYCWLVEPNNPAWIQQPGFNHTLGELIDTAASLETVVFPGTPSRTARIFIATDTITFVQEHLKHANASLRKQVLTLAGQDNPGETHDSRLQQLVVYWTSLDIAATCKGLVINRDSTTSRLFEWMACGKQSHCPLVKDLAQHRPDEEVEAAVKAWNNGIRPEGFKTRCASLRPDALGSALFGQSSGSRFQAQLWQ
jgi:hypothetical protein